ncbi:hypothetical protein BV22DRAFT_1041540 [Leucogyrophana mollusca]|uniref:Uncharacterized protein n=1 Tax=Leucogyrophana mollusca TaxID=85980 RepID=A0ACB8AZ89_9AGAM|nr:hypothetical protein BV22DRAFT_1041540 [Leucogyrophana mollusca]
MKIIDFNSIYWIHRYEVSKHIAGCRKSYGGTQSVVLTRLPHSSLSRSLSVASTNCVEVYILLTRVPRTASPLSLITHLTHSSFPPDPQERIPTGRLAIAPKPYAPPRPAFGPGEARWEARLQGYGDAPGDGGE